MLLLVDVDGTLLHGTPSAHTAALLVAAERVFGVRRTVADLRAIGPAGRTDQEIVRLLLRGAGLADPEITAGLPAWAEAAWGAYPEAARRHPDPVAAPDAVAAMGTLARAGAELALLTGNLEPIAHAKIGAAGLGPLFPRGRGAFGSDHEDRTALVPVARRRAGGRFPPERTVVVGDTPRDVACARAGGARVVAVTTGPHDATALAGADAVAASLTEAASVIGAWMASGGGPRPG